MNRGKAWIGIGVFFGGVGLIAYLTIAFATPPKLFQTPSCLNAQHLALSVSAVGCVLVAMTAKGSRLWNLLAVARAILLGIVFNSWLICMSVSVGGKSPWYWLYPEAEQPWFARFLALHTSAGLELVSVLLYVVVLLDTLAIGYLAGFVRNICRRKGHDEPIVSDSAGAVWPPPPNIPSA